MAVQHVVVVPKPLELIPTLPDPSADDPDSQTIARRLALARAEHGDAIEQVRACLAARCPEARWLDTPSREGLSGADLVITIGGDGTFLTVARHATAQPLLGVNSSPSTSVGHYCAATPATFEGVLDAVLHGRASPTPLTRIRAEIDGQRVPFDALNDVLFAHRVPVSSTRYALRVGERVELHLSSGIWVATGSGSTAAIRSAGGEVCAMTDQRLQWRVREPYVGRGEARRLLAGFTESGLEIMSRSDKNALFVDGHADIYPVGFGVRARLYPSPDPLFAVLPLTAG